MEEEETSIWKESIVVLQDDRNGEFGHVGGKKELKAYGKNRKKRDNKIRKRGRKKTVI